MALTAKLNDVEFGVGDRIRVHQRVKDGDKSRESIFEGMVLGLKGRNPTKTFMVRRIGEAGIGIEKIFPLSLPTIEKITVVKRGVEGSRRAKLYFTRTKSPTEIDSIFKKASKRISTKKK
jgi:large subunit ribosomal protein L19